MASTCLSPAPLRRFLFSIRLILIKVLSQVLVKLPAVGAAKERSLVLLFISILQHEDGVVDLKGGS